MSYKFVLSLLICLILTLPTNAEAENNRLKLRQILIFHSINGSTQAVKNFCNTHLHNGSIDVRLAVTGEDDTEYWVVGAPDGILTPDRFYNVIIGPNVKVAITADKSWIAGGQDGTVTNGQTVKNSQTARVIYEDMYKWKNSKIQQNNNTIKQRSTRNLQNDFAKRSQTSNSNPSAPRVIVNNDTTPPYIEKIEIIRFPDIPEKRRVYSPPSVFVGAEAVEIKVYMSEKMGKAPQVKITQNGSGQDTAQSVNAPLTINQAERIFTYRWFPNSSPQAAGSTRLEILGEYDGNNPDFGYDLALNPIPANSNGSVFDTAMIVDTVAPDLKRVDTSSSNPAIGQSIPSSGDTLSKTEFPETIMVFVNDYNLPDDGTMSGTNLDTSLASGVDFSLLSSNDGSMTLSLFKPDGSEIKGMVVARQPALELILPDVYDPVNQIFPDNDNDGVAEPIEGTYRIEVTITDKAGNKNNQTINFGMDTTPVASKDLNVSITPVFTTPFANPDNPIKEKGTFVKQLRGVEITSTSPQWSPARSSVKIEKWVPGTIPYPTSLKIQVDKTDDKITATIALDQDGDGVNDFENPERGQYVPDGERDPRWGKNDGVYMIKVKAYDKAGNTEDISRRLTIDTTPPQMETTFPNAEITIGPPLRMVDAMLIDPRPVSGADSSGLNFEHFNIYVEFMGNEQSAQQRVNGVGFIHEPNNSDPTIPSYNPEDKNPKLLFEFTDETGHVTPLPEDGTMDGVYTIHLAAWDKAGSEVTGSVGFTYSSTAPSQGTTTPQSETMNQPVINRRLTMNIR